MRKYPAEAAVHEIRQAIRSLRAAPATSALAVASLSLAIGATTSVFRVTDALLFRPLPVAEPGRLTTITSESALAHGFRAGHGWSYPMWLRLEERAGALGGALAWLEADFDLANSDEREPAAGLFVSSGYFAVLGVTAQIGRLLTPADHRPGGGVDGQVAVISDRFWARKFTRDPHVLNRPLSVNGHPLTIVGVTRRGFFGTEVGRSFDVAVPLGLEPVLRRGRSVLEGRRSFVLTPMLRLKPELTIEGATAQLRALQPDLLGVAPEQVRHVSPRFLQEPFVLVAAAAGTADGSGLRRRYGRPLATMLALVACVLLVACLNVAGLLIARTIASRPDFSLRLALGATRGHLARHLLIQSALLALTGALLGLLLAAWGARSLAAIMEGLPGGGFLDTAITWRALAFTTALAAAAMLLAGTVPGLRAARVPMTDVLKSGSRGAASGGRPFALKALVTAQIALSVVVLALTGLFVRSFERLVNVPLGFDSLRLLVVEVDLSRAAVPPPARTSFAHRLVGALARLPGVERAAASRLTPVSQRSSGPLYAQPDVLLENEVMPGWFATYGTPFRRGRDFDAVESAATAPVAIVNLAYERKFLDGRSAVGEVVDSRTIVGVVADAAFVSPRDGMRPTVYVPFSMPDDPEDPRGTRVTISLRAAGVAPVTLARGAATALAAVDPLLTFTFRSVADDVAASIARERVMATLSAVFAALVLPLAALGLYGVTAYAVNRERRRIGLQLALGSTPGGVLRRVMSTVCVLVLAGTLAGVAGSLLVGRVVSASLYGIEPHDTPSLLGAALVTTAVSLIAGWVPARRAASIDPAGLLRSE